jgi:enamine deaminase RidA (YjgF/YER057c/UK114 family)/sugar lactone lactonase YvrE
MLRFSALVSLALMTAVESPTPASAADNSQTRRYLYVVCPGIRNYPEFGGAGILVFDIDDGHKFVRRIETPASREEKPDNIKGVCACAATGRLYFTTRSKLYCVDLLTDKTLWEKELPNGTDRMSITPDGQVLYVPSFEKDTWNVVDGATGDLIAEIVTKSGAHNTVVGLDGSRMYLGGLKSPFLFVADTKTHKVINKVGPFGGAVRPFTVNGEQTRAYVCVNDLLGFEIGDLTTGKLLHRIEVKGYEKGMVKRHGCPSHGVGLTPDEREVWVVDAANQAVHIFDNTTDPPTQRQSLTLREQPGWVTFSLDGRYAYPSTGEVIDTATKKIMAKLTDETGREVHSEKMVEVHFRDGKPVANGDQFGVGRVREAKTGVKYLPGRDGTTRAAVVDGDAPLIHTAQVPLLSSTGFGPHDPHIADASLSTLERLLRDAGADPERVVRLNVVAVTPEVAEQSVAAVREWAEKHGAQPPVSVVVGRVPWGGAAAAIDVVAVATRAGEPQHRNWMVGDRSHPRFPYGRFAAVFPPGPRVFVSGQAERGASHEEAAAKTIAGLLKTLDWLGCKPADVVQAKCFVTQPMAASKIAAEFDKAFGKKAVPLAFVQWQSELPIEIELVAKAPPAKPDAPAVEYLTPPGMTASPIFARVVRVNRGDLIYSAGLTAPKPGTAEEQVHGVFGELKDILDNTGSDFRHLAKATYYVSTEDASRKLNELRPKFYDPKRPPAASKAFVPGVGMVGRSVMLDMIAVKVPTP